MSARYVTTARVNLRATPDTEHAPITTLAPGAGLTLLEIRGLWHRVDAGWGLVGWVHSAYTTPAAAPTPPPGHLPLPDFASPRAQLGSVDGRHARLPPLPGGPTDPHEIVRLLDVEHSARYQPTRLATYCNIYATDFAHALKIVLPRTWWTPAAITRLQAGEGVGIGYGTTVTELNANALYDWLSTWGAAYGWRQVADANAAQRAVNASGRIGVICAARTDPARSGHITVIVPETEAHQAARDRGVVLYPLQSQAGSTNRAYHTSNWWGGSQFRAAGMWVQG